MPHRIERPGELDELRRLNRALAGLAARFPAPRDGFDREDYAAERARLVAERQAEVQQLRSAAGGRWSYGQLADAFGVSRALAQLWAHPLMDRRPGRPGEHAPPVAWLAAASAWAGCGLGRVVCHLCVGFRHLVS